MTARYLLTFQSFQLDGLEVSRDEAGVQQDERKEGKNERVDLSRTVAEEGLAES